jgi:hypothetical protein
VAGSTLSNGATCTIAVHFEPVAAGTSQGTLTVGASNAKSVTAHVTGNAAAPSGSVLLAGAGDVWAVTSGGWAIVSGAAGTYALDTATGATKSFAVAAPSSVLVFGPYALVWDTPAAGQATAPLWVWSDATKQAASGAASYPGLGGATNGWATDKVVVEVPNSAGKGADIVTANVTSPAAIAPLVGQVSAPGGTQCFGLNTHFVLTSAHLFFSACLLNPVGGVSYFLYGYDTALASVLSVAPCGWSVSSPAGLKDRVHYDTGANPTLPYVDDFSSAQVWNTQGTQACAGRLSPDGQTLVLVNNLAGGSALATASYSSSPPFGSATQLYGAGFSGIWAVSPDTKWVLSYSGFLQDQGVGASDVSLAPLASGQQPTMLAAEPAHPIGFTPDSKALAYLANYDTTSGVGDLFAALPGSPGVKLAASSSVQALVTTAGAPGWAFNGNVQGATGDVFYTGESNLSPVLVAPGAHARFAATPGKIVYGWADAAGSSASGIYVFTLP